MGMTQHRLPDSEIIRLLSALPTVVEVRPGDDVWNFMVRAAGLRLQKSMRVFSVGKARGVYIDPRHINAVNEWCATQTTVPDHYAWHEDGTDRIIVACWRFRTGQQGAAEAFAAKWLRGFH
jgi:hypothetical protein